MPELPEVETIARGLQKVIVGKRIKEVEAIFPGIVRQDFKLYLEFRYYPISDALQNCVHLLILLTVSLYVFGHTIAARFSCLFRLCCSILGK